VSEGQVSKPVFICIYIHVYVYVSCMYIICMYNYVRIHVSFVILTYTCKCCIHVSVVSGLYCVGRIGFKANNCVNIYTFLYVRICVRIAYACIYTYTFTRKCCIQVSVVSDIYCVGRTDFEAGIRVFINTHLYVRICTC